ncbi:hypothetical protein GOV07_04755 [Candidatus Woesearchaeota archaeon]|nr:hypothetical protein [Candidatus Woesearchaeota archaeon]
MVVINIDTSKDSKEEIKQTIKYLQTLVDGESSSDSGFINPFAEDSSDSSDDDSSPLDMFDNPLAEPESDEPDDTVDVASILAEDNDDDDDESDFSSEAEIIAEDTEDVYIEIVDYD